MGCACGLNSCDALRGSYRVGHYGFCTKDASREGCGRCVVCCCFSVSMAQCCEVFSGIRELFEDVHLEADFGLDQVGSQVHEFERCGKPTLAAYSMSWSVGDLCDGYHRVLDAQMKDCADGREDSGSSYSYYSSYSASASMREDEEPDFSVEADPPINEDAESPEHKLETPVQAIEGAVESGAADATMTGANCEDEESWGTWKPGPSKVVDIATASSAPSAQASSHVSVDVNEKAMQARRKGREIEVRIYLNKAMVDSFDMTTVDMPLDKIVQQVATIAQSVTDVKAWLKTTTNVPIRPLWGSLSDACLLRDDHKGREIERLAALDTQDGTPKSQICEAFQLVIKSMTASTEALACVWRALEPGHTRVAMQHIWHALLGAVGLPNTGYLDRLPGAQGQERGERADFKQDSQTQVGEKHAEAQSTRRSSKDMLAIEDCSPADVHRKEQRGSKSASSDGQQGKGVLSAGQPTTRKIGVPPDAGKQTKNKAGAPSASGGPKVKKIGTPPTQGPQGGCAKRRCPFAKEEVSVARGDVGLGKPPPPIDVDDDTEEEDAVSKYRKRLEMGSSSSMSKQARGDNDTGDVPHKRPRGKTRDVGIRLTPVPPQPSRKCEIPQHDDQDADEGEFEDYVTQWWDKRERSDACAADAPWRANKRERIGLGRDAAIPIAPQTRHVEAPRQRTVAPLAKGVVPYGNQGDVSAGFRESRIVTLEKAGSALVDGELGYWDGNNLIPAPPRAARTPVKGSALEVPMHLRVPKLPAPVYPKHTGKTTASCAAGVAPDELVANSGKRVPVPPKFDGLSHDIQLGCVACVQSHDMDSSHEIKSSERFDADVASILFCLGGILFSCGAMFVQVSSLCGSRAMHVTGYITGTDGSHYQWHPFRQVGWGDDNVSRHTLLNTHDLISMYGRHCEQTVRDVYDDAVLGMLRPRHNLYQDTREGIEEQLDLARAVAQGIELDPAYNMNSDTETIEDVLSADGASSLAVHEGDESGQGIDSSYDDRSPFSSAESSGPMPSCDTAFGLSNQATKGSSSSSSICGHAQHDDWKQCRDEDEHYDTHDMFVHFSGKKCGLCMRVRDVKVLLCFGLLIMRSPHTQVGWVVDYFSQFEFGCQRESVHCGIACCSRWHAHLDDVGGIDECDVWAHIIVCKGKIFPGLYVKCSTRRRIGHASMLLVFPCHCIAIVSVTGSDVHFWVLLLDPRVVSLMESDDDRGHMDGESTGSSSEGGVDDSTGCRRIVRNIGAVGGLRVLRNRARRHQTHHEGILGRWRPRPPAHFELDELILDLHARLSRIANNADEEQDHEDDLISQGEDDGEEHHWHELNAAMRRLRDRQRLENLSEGTGSCLDGRAPHEDEGSHPNGDQHAWLEPSLRNAISNLDGHSCDVGHRVVDLADVRAWHFENLQASAVADGSNVGCAGDGLSTHPLHGSSDDSSPGSQKDETWPDDYDCCSYGTSRYAEWSSSVASSPGEVSDTFFDVGEVAHFLWEGDGPYPPRSSRGYTPVVADY
eukprot:1260865-Amphidinium_carterae.1